MSKTIRKFTIIELMIALIIFSMMMGMVMYFFSQSQRAWQDSDGIVRVLQNSRTIFEMIEYDLMQAQATKRKEAMIPFAIVENKGDHAFGPFPYMVCKTAPSSNARSSLAEVSYTVGTITSSDQRTEDSAGQPLNYFKRSTVFDYNSSSRINPYWDFYNTAPGSDVSWTTGSGVKSFPVVGGVLELTMTFYALDATPSDYNARTQCTHQGDNNSPTTLKYKEMGMKETFTSLPQYVEIELSLFDYITESANDCHKTKRTFYKRIYLSQGSRAYNNQQFKSN
jgi:type II secretory pathway pseudopilin PulG